MAVKQTLTLYPVKRTNWTSLYNVDDNVKSWRKIRWCFRKNKTYKYFESTNPIARCQSQIKAGLRDVRWSPIYSSPKPEATQMSADEWKMKKTWSVSYNRIIVSLTKKWTFYESWRHALWSKLVQKNKMSWTGKSEKSHFFFFPPETGFLWSLSWN